MSLNDIPEAEARALLSKRYVCDGWGPWAPAKAAPEAFHLICGLLDEDGSRTPLYVELFAKISQKTKVAHYVFSIKRHRPLSGRIYQLEVKTSPKSLKDAHQMPHEHIGRSTICGNATWMDWGFNEVLTHFAEQTNIEFRPPLESPLDFKLRPS